MVHAGSKFIGWSQDPTRCSVNTLREYWSRTGLLTPFVDVAGVSAWTQLTAGPDFFCGLEQGTQNAYCMGTVPHRCAVPAPTDAAHGDSAACARPSPCVGCKDYLLGRKAGTHSFPTPVAVDNSTVASWLALDAGGELHVCGIAANLKMYCWGNAVRGRLGTPSDTYAYVPVAVSADLSWVALSAGSQHTCGITTGFEVACFGE